MRSLRANVKWIMLTVVIIFSLSILGYYGFGSGGGGGGNAPNDYAVAKVDGKKIMRSTLERSLRDYVQRSNVQDVTSADLPRLYKQTLDSIVVQTALSKEADELGIEATDIEIDQQIGQIEDQFPTKEAFQQYIERSGIKMKELRANISNQLAQMKLLESALMDVNVGEEEMIEFYNETKGIFFHQPSGMKANIAGFSSRSAAEHVKHLLSNGIEWEDAFNQVDSEDVIQYAPYEQTVFIPENRMVDNLEPVKDLSVLEVSDVIEVVSGDEYAIFVNRGFESSQDVPFEEVSSDVREMLINQKERTAQQKYLEEIKNKINVEILDPELFASNKVKTDSVASEDIKKVEN